MRSHSTLRLIAIGLILCLSGNDTGMAQSAEPVEVGTLQTFTATVESIDVEKRLVELRSAERTTTVQVPAEVRNLTQLKVGDQVVVEYYEALAAQFKKKGTSATIGVVDVELAAERALPGAKPAADITSKVSSTVVIDAVNPSTHSVTFTGPTGMTRTVNVKDPRAREFVATLKQGDEVELTYVEALAIKVEPKR